MPEEWQNVPAENIKRFQKSVRYKRADNKEDALEKFKLTFQKLRLWNEVLKIEKTADAQLAIYFGKWIKSIIPMNLILLLFLVHVVYIGIRCYVKDWREERGYY